MGKRLFTLYNESGTGKALNGESGIRFTSPAGLGISMKPTLADLHEGFFRPAAEDIIPQQSIAGSLTFMGKNTNGTPISGGSYGQYLDFVNWLFTAKKLYFGYTPQGTGGTEYRCEVALDYITKTERRGTWLPCTVSFKMLTPWFTVQTATATATRSSSGATTTFTASFTPTGHVPAGIEITAGNGKPPSRITLTQSGQPTKETRFAVSGLTGVFSFSSEKKNSGAWIGSIGMMDYAHTADETPFMRAVPGTAATLRIIYDGTSNVPSAMTSIKIFEYYRTV